MSKQKNPFYRVSSLVTATDLQCRLAPHVESDENAFEAQVRLMTDETGNRVDAVSLVMSGPDVVGWWTAFDAEVEEGNPATVAEGMYPIKSSMLVSGNTTFYDIADALATREHPFLFVLDGSEFTGTLSYFDLFSRTGQLCLLSLTFLLESVAEELCLREPQQCWSALPERRRTLAERVASRRFHGRAAWADALRRRDLALLLRSTTFIDKCTMIVGAKLLPAVATTVVEAVFEKAERVRNLCAHGADYEELTFALPQSKFAGFLHDTQNLVETIRGRDQELSGFEL